MSSVVFIRLLEIINLVQFTILWVGGWNGMPGPSCVTHEFIGGHRLIIVEQKKLYQVSATNMMP